MRLVKLLLSLTALVIAFQPLNARADWDYTNRSENINPLKCDYRLVSASKLTDSNLLYYFYDSSNFRADVTRGRATSLELYFEVKPSAIPGLVEFLAPADKQDFNNILSSPNFGCRIELQATSAHISGRQTTKAKLEYNLHCSGGSESDGTSSDFAAVYSLLSSKVNLQDNCRR